MVEIPTLLPRPIPALLAFVDARGRRRDGGSSTTAAGAATAGCPVAGHAGSAAGAPHPGGARAAADATKIPVDLRRMAAAVPDPVAGFYGPGSMFWRLAREQALFAGGPAAALLQLAHPQVAAGVRQHSDFHIDPVGRQYRTFSIVFQIVFGTADEAVAAAARARAIHTGVKGTTDEAAGPFSPADRYHANRPDLLLWVHATLVDQAIRAYELFVAPLTAAEREQYYQESKVFARLFGIPDSDIPDDLAAFRAYFDATVAEEIAVGANSAWLKAQLFGGIPRYRPLLPANVLLASAMLPPTVRTQFGLPWNWAMNRAFQALRTGVRRSLPLLPDRLRYQGYYLRALKRLRKGRRAS